MVCNVLCLFDRERHKNAVNSASVQNVCAKTALTDSSSDKKQLQGTIIILRNCIHIQFWEMEDTNKINFLFNVFHFLM